MKTTKTIKQIEEITYECEVCSRQSQDSNEIKNCEANHKECGSNHTFWIDLHLQVMTYKLILRLLDESDKQVMIVDIRSENIGPKYAIVPPHRQSYWIAAYKTKKECVKLCKELAWKIIEGK